MAVGSGRCPMPSPTCPSPKDLRELLLGQLPDEQSDGLEKHLSKCPPCAQTVESLKLDDTLVQALRGGAAAVQKMDQAVPANLLPKVQAIAGAAAPPSTTLPPGPMQALPPN